MSLKASVALVKNQNRGKMVVRKLCWTDRATNIFFVHAA
jgi:hypothetical protein